MGKAKKKARRSAPSVQQAVPFVMGDQVRVRAGDYGNHVGTYQGQRGGNVLVQLAGEIELREFDGANVERGGHKDRF